MGSFVVVSRVVVGLSLQPRTGTEFLDVVGDNYRVVMQQYEKAKKREGRMFDMEADWDDLDEARREAERLWRWLQRAPPIIKAMREDEARRASRRPSNGDVGHCGGRQTERRRSEILNSVADVLSPDGDRLHRILSWGADQLMPAETDDSQTLVGGTDFEGQKVVEGRRVSIPLCRCRVETLLRPDLSLMSSIPILVPCQ